MYTLKVSLRQKITRKEMASFDAVKYPVNMSLWECNTSDVSVFLLRIYVQEPVAENQLAWTFLL